MQTAREQPAPRKAFRTVLVELELALERDLDLSLGRPPIDELLTDPATAVFRYLRSITERAPRPLVLLIDEADGLVGEAMVSFLTQLRRGYLDRDARAFPRAIALVGMRQVRDYVLSTEDRRAVSWLGTTSPFNIAAESAGLRAFMQDEIAELLAQHTTATGQVFDPAAIERCQGRMSAKDE